MIEETHLRRLALNEFNRARRRANLSQITDRLIGRPDKLIPFETIRAEILQRNPRSLGLQQVPLDRIIGSVGRYREFNRQFLPLDDSLKERWVAVDTLAASRGWPPVNLYKIGETYYVDDGNHRVSVGRQLGNSTIEAYVMEFSTEAVIRPDQTLDEMLISLSEERFLELTRLRDHYPAHGIEFTTPGRHRELVAQIEEMRQTLSLIDDEEWSFAEAVPAWYEMVYLPTVQIIRESDLLDNFSGRTEADLFAWLSKHRQALTEQLGETSSLVELAQRLADEYGESSLQKMTRKVLGLVNAESPALLPEIAE
ncbi:MAG: hypothetical protein KDE09_00525 [Anaerolineales bacterium]|nr:hypothetical protein [Anaerolineales bacterium]MCB0004923.1 hypothetical protein [Anaerolineales bacterium]MCB0016235.1 hypothetical protein [Anaerolineales bacterium]MCB8960813.1 hypothetical protein [Ardenticatenales bacterium]